MAALGSNSVSYTLSLVFLQANATQFGIDSADSDKAVPSRLKGSYWTALHDEPGNRLDGPSSITWWLDENTYLATIGGGGGISCVFVTRHIFCG
jgi:hypothetical protein